MIAFIFLGLIATLIFSYLVSQKGKDWKLYLMLYVIAIFFIGYSFPVLGTDLNTYFGVLDHLTGMDFNSANQYLSNMFSDNLYFRNLIFWLIANSFSFHLLPAISTASVYGISAYIVCDYCSRKRYENYIGLILMVQYAFLPLQSIVGNVRNVWAFSLIILATYRDVIQHKRGIITLLIYILPCYLHTSGVLMLLLRLISSIRKFKIVWFLIVLFLSPIINFLYNNEGFFPDLIIHSINTAYNYLHDVGGINVLSTSVYSLLQKVLMFTISLLFIILILLLKEKLSKGEETYVYFNFLIFVFVLACNIFVSAHYWRFFCAGIISSAVIETLYLANYKRISFIQKCTFNIVLSLSIIMFGFNMIMILAQ